MTKSERDALRKLSEAATFGCWQYRWSDGLPVLIVPDTPENRARLAASDKERDALIAAVRAEERERIAKSEEWWLGVYDCPMEPSQIMDELADFHMVSDHCSKVYDHFTLGRISKPNTWPSEVITVAEEIQSERINEAVAEAEGSARAEALEEAAVVCEDFAKEYKAKDVGAIVAQAVCHNAKHLAWRIRNRKFADPQSPAPPTEEAG